MSLASDQIPIIGAWLAPFISLSFGAVATYIVLLHYNPACIKEILRIWTIACFVLT